jgi:hippurate hydrolase
MVEDGLWEKAPRPAVVLGQHVMPQQAGTVHLATGTAMAMADALRITVFGRQSHGSQPQDAIDPIVLGAHIITRLQTIVSRELHPTSPAVVTSGTFHAGLKENIIPDRAEFTLNIRTFTQDVRETVLAAIRRIISAEAAASAAPEPSIEEIYTFPRCHNDPGEAGVVSAALVRAFGPGAVHEAQAVMGSEDVGHLSDSIGVPGVYWFFGGFELSDGPAPVNHSPFFGPVMEPTLSTAARAALAAILAYVAADR